MGHPHALPRGRGQPEAPCLLWRELCLYRGSRMMSMLTEGATNNTIIGGWPALVKLLYYCSGCESTRYFRLRWPLSGHFVETRFSKTSGRSFLAKRCRGDVLYVERADDVGIYRGVFWEFMKLRTRDFLIRKQVELEEEVRCPFCAARVWSMSAARLIPQRSVVARRLGSSDGSLEYFVCLNGHLHDTCWLVPLSSASDDDSACRNRIGGANHGN